MKKTLKPNNPFRVYILIFFLLAGLMIISALIEFNQSKKELVQLMTSQSESLLESLIIASQTTLQTSAYLDDLNKKHLLEHAGTIKYLYDNESLDSQTLHDMVSQNNIYQVDILSRDGELILSSNNETNNNSDFQRITEFILPLSQGVEDTILTSYRSENPDSRNRLIVAFISQNRTAIVLQATTDKLQEFKRDIDFGTLIRNLVRDNPQIEYVALQDTTSILAASGNVRSLEGIDDIAFLKEAWQNQSFSTRITEFEEAKIFEAVQPFIFSNDIIGLFRLGLSLGPLSDINSRILRRLIIITLILIVIGYILFILLFTRQKLSIIEKQYDLVETYSGNIIENVSDATIVLDKNQGIKIFNNAAEHLFHIKREMIRGKDLNTLFPIPECRSILEEKSIVKQINCQIGGKTKNLLISKSSFHDRDWIENTIMVIRDLTEQKQIEAQLERQERLTAIGELASGVAHEIRNPLNTIGTIIQQLDKDFEPEKDSEEYHSLAKLVHSEVKRINQTVQDFLLFSKPAAIHPSEFKLADFLHQIEKQYESLFHAHHIQFKMSINWKGRVHWDSDQIKQVLMNLIQNALDAIENNGQIILSVSGQDNGQIEIRIKDNGPGIPENIQSNIFNLYFTTKAKGTGIGLSLVQKIIYEHGGMISVESTEKEGSTFIIRLPEKTDIPHT